jgi:hypothetical protein
LTLASTGSIFDASPTDGPAARTILDNSANFTAIDVILGESGEDFFDILSGNAPGLANVSGTANVQVGRV